MSDTELFWISYVGFGVLFTIAELVAPAHDVRYRKGVPFDLVALAVYQLAVIPLSLYVTDPLYDYIPAMAAARVIPLPIRFVLVYLAADLGAYGIHRLIHTRHLWRVHRFHHSVTELYWLSGVRASLPQQILVNLPPIVVVPLIADAPLWVFGALLVESTFRNHWMHANVGWGARWLEYVFVTPRYHAIHHSTDEALHDANFGALFTMWDRLFGTYRSPDEHVPKKFGTGEKKRDPVLMMIGV